MVLKQIEQGKNWIRLKWDCNFPMKWPNIMFATRKLLPTMENYEVRIGEVGSYEKIDPSLTYPQRGMINIRGYAKALRSEVSIMFYTDTTNAMITIKDYSLPKDYESIAIALGPFMDRLELLMFGAQ